MLSIKHGMGNFDARNGGFSSAVVEMAGSLVWLGKDKSGLESGAKGRRVVAGRVHRDPCPFDRLRVRMTTETTREQMQRLGWGWERVVVEKRISPLRSSR